MCAISIYYYHKQHTIIQQRHSVARERASEKIINTRHKSSLTHANSMERTTKGKKTAAATTETRKLWYAVKGSAEIFWSLPLLLLLLLLLPLPLHNYTQYIFIRKRGINNGRLRKWWVNYVAISRHLIANIDFNRPIVTHTFSFLFNCSFPTTTEKNPSRCWFHFICSNHIILIFMLMPFFAVFMFEWFLL